MLVEINCETHSGSSQGQVITVALCIQYEDDNRFLAVNLTPQALHRMVGH